MFAAAAEAAGVRQAELQLPEGSCVGDAVTLCRQRWPGLSRLGDALLVAVNQEYAQLQQPLSDGDELALIPPVSGGQEAGDQLGSACAPARRFAVVAQPLRAEQVAALVASPQAGAITLFVGTVREWTAGRRTLWLEYEAYVEMAEAKLRQIAQEVEAQWPGTQLAVWHRVGRLAPGEASVVIAAAAPHREEAFAAARYAIERLKRVVPIWKREVWEDGSAWVGSQLDPFVHPERSTQR